jgi:hypothetical protein
MRKIISLFIVSVVLVAGTPISSAQLLSAAKSKPAATKPNPSTSTWQLDFTRRASKTLKCPGIKASITYEMVSGFGPGKKVIVQWYNGKTKDAKQTMIGDELGWRFTGQEVNNYLYGQPSFAEVDGVRYQLFIGSNSGSSERWWYQGILDPEQVVGDTCDQFAQDIKFTKDSINATIKSFVVLYVSRAGTFSSRGGSNLKK